jgi:ATP-dependent helicase/nuclease subunit B
MTRLFEPLPGPRVFTLAPGIDFVRAFVDGLDARLAGQPPEAVARVTIWVNTRRAQRSLRAVFAEGPARLLPRIHVLADLADDPLFVPQLPTVPALRRKLELARLVARLVAAEPAVAAETAAFELADSLADLLEEMQGEGVPLAALNRIEPGDHAAHWQRSLRFLGILKDYAAGSADDGQGRLRAATELLRTVWTGAPPDGPVIVAGSTGSRGGTRAFMALVAHAPQGALVLPGFDADLPDSVWRGLTSAEGAGDHPQAGFASLARTIGFDPAGLQPWHDAAPPAPERNALVSLALRPAPVTDQWRSEGARLRGRLGRACAELTWIEAPDPRAEARVIAFVLREAAEHRISAALITPDRMLARRVTAELDRWRLVPDDSAGRPLGLTPPGGLLRLLADLDGAPPTAVALLALLKHPLVNSAPGARRRHMDLTSRLETGLLRGGAPWISWKGLAAWAERIAERSGQQDARDWVAWLRSCLEPFGSPDRDTLPQRVARHRAAAESLAAGPAGSAEHGLWQKEAGAAALALMDELATEAEAFGDIGPAEYRALLSSQMTGRDVPEEAVVADTHVKIWGTLEARVQTAELAILGGLNEGIWPRQPAADPWLSRTLRREIGLPLPERQIGLAAHDFQQAIGAPRVLLTRATRDAEAPTVASRWLLRLENLLGGLGAEGEAALAGAKSRGRILLRQSVLLDRPDTAILPARRPSPRPPPEARPAELSVTQLETLVRDPYAIYAKKVLRLEKLDGPGRIPDAMARGSVIHAALETFVRSLDRAPPDEAHRLFREATEASLCEDAPWPAIQSLWRARLLRSADWFITTERTRRARGRPAAYEIRGRRDIRAPGGSFTVTAKADRIDFAADGGYAIYDYKSGSVPSEKEVRAFHLQLPLEAAIAAAGGFKDLSPKQAIHLELIGLNARATREIPSDAGEIATTWARLRELIAAYQDPATGYTARLRPQRLVYASDYDHLSRKGEWSDGDDPEPAT